MTAKILRDWSGEKTNQNYKKEEKDGNISILQKTKGGKKKKFLSN